MAFLFLSILTPQSFGLNRDISAKIKSLYKDVICFNYNSLQQNLAMNVTWV